MRKYAAAEIEQNLVLAFVICNQRLPLYVLRPYRVSAPRVAGASTVCMLLDVLDEGGRLLHGRATTCQGSVLCIFASLQLS